MLLVKIIHSTSSFFLTHIDSNMFLTDILYSLMFSLCLLTFSEVNRTGPIKNKFRLNIAPFDEEEDIELYDDELPPEESLVLSCTSLLVSHLI